MYLMTLCRSEIFAVSSRFIVPMRSIRCTEVKVDRGAGCHLVSIHIANFTVRWRHTSSVRQTGKHARIGSRTVVSDRQAADADKYQATAQLVNRIITTGWWHPNKNAQLTLGKERQDQTLALALNYQLVTDQTNLILVHVREEGNKAESLPELK